ncbi:MAG: GNAT family N-acetyltransferase [Acidobacteriota bacterium]|nr:MAG: GNAT family N-acetyltransferase [Acidobacteriota bacterium]
MRRATVNDIPLLVDLMDEFYTEADYELNRLDAANAFKFILSNESLGYIWLIEFESAIAGYLVITLKFGMEYGGIMACLDDLFVKSAFRNKGLSTRALANVRDFCKTEGVRAISVEVGKDNGPAQVVYRRAGFVNTDRQLLAMALDNPLHAA